MTTITAILFENAESWLKENVPDMEADGVSAIRPVTAFNAEGTTRYKDSEEGTSKDCTMADHVQALKLLCDSVGKTLFVGGIKSPIDLVDPCNWDSEVYDAFFQYVMLGEVIYG